MRLMHLIPSLGGGGAERQLAMLVREQVKCGVDVHVVTLRGGTFSDAVRAAGGVLSEVGLPGRTRYEHVVMLWRALRDVAPDVMQTWLPTMDLVGGILARAHRVPWVLSERCSAEAHERPVLRNHLRVAIARGADAIVSNSHGGDRYWASRVPKALLRTVIPNALPLDEIALRAGDAPVEPLPSDFVLFAGRLTPQKNLRAVLEAMERIVASAPISAVLCGDGPDRAWVADWIAHRKLGDRIHLRSYRTDIWSVMRRARACLSMSRFEGHPNVVLEAMACGCPIVASDIPSHREFLDGSVASLVGVDDAAAAAHAVLELSSKSPGEARRLRARERVGTLTAGATASRYAMVYDQVLSGRAFRVSGP